MSCNSVSLAVTITIALARDDRASETLSFSIVPLRASRARAALPPCGWSFPLFFSRPVPAAPAVR